MVIGGRLRSMASGWLLDGFYGPATELPHRFFSTRQPAKIGGLSRELSRFPSPWHGRRTNKELPRFLTVSPFVWLRQGNPTSTKSADACIALAERHRVRAILERPRRTLCSYRFQWQPSTGRAALL